MDDPLRALIAPSRVAIVGLDARLAPSGRALAARLSAGGGAFALDVVDPAGGDGPGGLPVRRRAADLPEAPDLALLAVDPRDVRWQLEAVLARGARAVVVLSDARADARAGDAPPDALADLAAARGALLLGPASAGVAAPGAGLVAIPDAPPLAPGAVAIVSRSGSGLGALLAAAARRNLGLSWVVDLGGAPSLDVAAALAAAHRDESVRCVLLAATDLGEAAPALLALAALAADKPVVALGPDAPLLAALGAFRATTEDVAAHLAAHLAAGGPAPRGPRVAVVTDEAALGALAVASLEAGGLTLAPPSPESARQIAGEVHVEARLAGVVDLLGVATARHLAVAAETLADDDGVDAIAVCCARVPAGALDAARERAHAAGKPLLAAPPADAARALAALLETSQLPAPGPAQREESDPNKAQAVLAGAILMRRAALSGDEARRFVAAYGVDTARTITVVSPMAARRAAAELGFPVTLTIRATGHVARRAGLRDGDAVDDAVHALFADAPQADPTLAFELRRTPSAERVALLEVTAHPRLGAQVALQVTPGAGAAMTLAIAAARAPEVLVARALGVAPAAAPPALVALVARVAHLALDFPELARLTLGPIADEAGSFSVLEVSARLPPGLMSAAW